MSVAWGASPRFPFQSRGSGKSHRCSREATNDGSSQRFYALPTRGLRPGLLAWRPWRGSGKPLIESLTPSSRAAPFLATNVPCLSCPIRRGGVENKGRIGFVWHGLVFRRLRLGRCGQVRGRTRRELPLAERAGRRAASGLGSFRQPFVENKGRIGFVWRILVSRDRLTRLCHRISPRLLL
jgi:hypothetical protein